MEEQLVEIINEMAEVLNASQLKKLQEVLLKHLESDSRKEETTSNQEYLEMFLNAKKIEGCSDRTIDYYRVTVTRMFQDIKDPIRKITTEQIREYLVNYQGINNCGKTTVDNIRRNISSFSRGLRKRIIY